MPTPPSASSAPARPGTALGVATSLVHFGSQVLDYRDLEQRREILRREAQLAARVREAQLAAAANRREADVSYAELLLVQQDISRQIAVARAAVAEQEAAAAKAASDARGVPAWVWVGGALVIAAAGALALARRSGDDPVPAPARPRARR